MPDRADDDALAATIAPSEVPPGSQPPVVRPPSSGRGSSVRITRSVAPGLDGDREAELPVVEPGLYTTSDEIARGGMGRIISATDLRLGRPVALKELLAHGPEAAARFRREALITARLQHPAIVPVYEAGQWPGGEPFFAMKLVSGKPLDQVIATCKTLEDRLALLPSVIAVCEAIAYAHQQRIVHRDLKPANVLIGDFGETVVIDWGLAKDLDAAVDDAMASAPARRAAAARAATDTEAPSAGLSTEVPREQTTMRDGSTLTIAGAVMGTPAYMPPEQARGDAVDERADVFSLGAMLYHVLAGAPPYAAKTATDVMAHAIAGKVVPLRTRTKEAPADLAAIVERALKLEPAERYPTARELAEELRRFQTGQLVGAHRYSAWERIARFVRRHRAAVTIAAVAVIGFAVGGTIAVRRIVAERDRAETARTQAERRREAAEKLVDFMVSDMRDRLDEVGQLALMAGLGANVRDYYDDLSDLPGGMNAEDVDRMAIALDILGAAERQKGDLDAALATFQDARARLRELVDRDPGAAETPARRGAMARATAMIGAIYQARGKTDDALASYREAVELYDLARAASPRERELLRGEASAHDKLGDLLRNKGSAEEALDEYGMARGLRQEALDLGDPTDPTALDLRFDLTTSDMKLGSAEQLRGDTPAALEHYRASVAGREALVAAAPDRLELQHGLSYVRGVLAALLRETGELDEARAADDAALATLDTLVRKDPENTEWRRDRGNALAEYGFVLADLGDTDGALAAYAKSLENHAVLTARDPANSQWQIDVSRTHTRAGDAQLSRGEVTEALASYRAGKAIRQSLVDRDPKSTPWRRSLAWSHHKLALALPFARDVGGARAEGKAALAIREELVAASPSNTPLVNELALSEFVLGRLEERAGNAAQAVTYLDRAVERGQKLYGADPSNLEWQESLTAALIVRIEARLGADDVAGAAADAAAAIALSTAVTVKLPDSPSWRENLAEARWNAAAVVARDPAQAATLGTRAENVAAARAILDALDAEHHLGFEKRELLARVRAAS
jgi:serine/threonine protein kinase/predicted negative regulator of RcsB-dependent stress response